MDKVKSTFWETYPRPLFGIKRFIGLREISPAYECPIGWGLAYWDYMYMKGYIYPIPFNWIIWLIREAYHILRNTPTGLKDKYWREGYETGVHDAYEIREKDIIKLIGERHEHDTN